MANSFSITITLLLSSNILHCFPNLGFSNPCFFFDVFFNFQSEFSHGIAEEHVNTLVKIKSQSSTCTTSKQYMPTQHKSNRAGSCTTSEVQLKVNHRPKVHHRIRIWAGSANSWKNSISLNSILQFTFRSNSLVHDLSPYIHTGVKVLRQRQRAAFPLYEKCNV